MLGTLNDREMAGACNILIRLKWKCCNSLAMSTSNKKRRQKRQEPVLFFSTLSIFLWLSVVYGLCFWFSFKKSFKGHELSGQTTSIHFSFMKIYWKAHFNISSCVHLQNLSAAMQRLINLFDPLFCPYIFMIFCNCQQTQIFALWNLWVITYLPYVWIVCMAFNSVISNCWHGLLSTNIEFKRELKFS